ncbi:MAG TPA: lysophospholipid acyltransferase family protein [Thermoanaerobaculia bacterium]|nr:lysophospholipid acyltransferase family protein [Thermoanaerobaculia bacterium]
MSKPPWKSRLRSLRGRLLATVLGGLGRWLGRRELATAQRLGRAIGRIAWWFGRRDRRRALDHLTIAFPERSPRERRRLARRSFLHLGTTLAETLRLAGGDCAELDRMVDVEGWERVEALRATGRAIVILTGHCGNWEMLAALINCRGLAMAVVGRRLEEPGLQAMLIGLRRRFGTETIERGEAGSARRLLATVRGGGALGMLIDQDIRAESVFVPFFGRPVHTPVGTAKLALRLDAAVVPAFIERLPDGRHRAVFHPPLDLPADPTRATAAMTRAIEEQIRRVPEQWVWLHRRWRRQPLDSEARAS